MNNILREVIKNVKAPRQIIVGDPAYFNKDIDIKINLDEITYRKIFPRYEIAKCNYVVQEYKDAYGTNVEITINYAYTEESLKLFSEGKYYNILQPKLIPIGVDTARYLIQVDNRTLTFITGYDGGVGEVIEFLHQVLEKGTHFVGATIKLDAGDNSFDEVCKSMEYLFEGRPFTSK